MTWKDNPIVVSVSFLICVVLFTGVFLKTGIECWRDADLRRRVHRPH